MTLWVLIFLFALSTLGLIVKYIITDKAPDPVILSALLGIIGTLVGLARG